MSVPTSEPSTHRSGHDRRALLLTLLATSAAGATLALSFGALWFAERAAPPEVADLTARQRQELVEALVRQSPGIFQAAWFAPRLAYTMRPDTEITAWGHTFRSNEIGYRTGPVPKAEDTVRILFVGDSWTFGMGVAEKETFAARFERLAEAYAGTHHRVESWVLALPGYNTFNQIAAVELFGDRLRPDLVVFVPSPNDIDSSFSVLPNGSLTRFGVTRDAWGARRPVVFQVHAVDSFEFRSRWRHSMAALRDTTERLAAREVPVLLFFTGSWRPIFVHRLVTDSGIAAPYVLTPTRLTTPEWRNPPPIDHPTVRAHDVYARLVYAGVASVRGWPPLPPDEVRELDGEEMAVHREPPRRRAVIRGSDRYLASFTDRFIPERFAPSEESSRHQCVGVLDPTDGSLGPGGAVLVRRSDASRLRVTVVREAGTEDLFPLQLTARIPAPEGGARVVTTVPSGDASVHVFEIDVPDGIAPGSAIDLVLTVDRIGLGLEGWSPRSVRVLAVEPMPEGSASR